MSSGLEHIWDDDDDGNVILASQRPNGEARKNPQPLFLGDSDDDMAGGPTNAQITEELDDADLDAILNLDVGEIDDIDLSTDFDTEAYRQESAARLRKNMTLHPILPSSSPPRGMGDDDDDGTGTKAKKGGKSTTNAGKTKRQQLKLDENRLLGEFGFPALIKDTKDFKPKGKGHEASDLDRLLKIYQFWTHRLYPKTPFRDTVERVEKLCHSRRMHVSMTVWKDAANGKLDDTKDDEAEDEDEDEEQQRTMQVDLAIPQMRSSPSSSRPPSSMGNTSGPGDDDDDLWAAMEEAQAEQAATAAAVVAPKSTTTATQDYMDWDTFDEVAGNASQRVPKPPVKTVNSTVSSTAVSFTLPDDDDEPPPPGPGGMMILPPPDFDDFDDMY